MPGELWFPKGLCRPQCQADLNFSLMSDQDLANIVFSLSHGISEEAEKEWMLLLNMLFSPEP